MRTQFRSTAPFVLGLTLALVLPTTSYAEDSAPPAAERAQETAEKPALVTLHGKLEWRQKDDAPPEVHLVAGKQRIAVTGFEPAQAKKLRRKLVSARGRVATEEGTLTLEKPTSLALQELTEILGIVTESEDVKSGLVLVSGDHVFEIDRRDASKFKEWIGLHVGAITQRVDLPGHRALVGVKDVIRRLRHGERAPESGEEAIAGAWSGSLVAEKVPTGVPNVKAGDAFGLAFTTDVELENTAGRLFDTYDVVGIRLRKFKGKTRTAQVEVAYSFGQGSYAIRLEGTFSRDWKTFSGEWESGFLGSGTFELGFQDPETP